MCFLLHLCTVLTALQKVPVLAISNIESFAHRGGTINLVKVRDYLRFSIDLDASIAANLKLSSKFHSLSTQGR